MRSALTVVVALMAAGLPGCETVSQDLSQAGALSTASIDNVEDAAGAKPKQEPSSGRERADRLLRLAADIEARGEYGTAATLYERAAVVSGGAPDVHVRLGNAYLQIGRTGEALKAFRAALAKEPENGPALLGYGSALVRQGDLQQGLATLTKAAPLVETAAAHNRLGVAQTLAGLLAEAQLSYEKAHALAPKDLDITTNLALAAMLMDDTERAVTLMREVAQSPLAELHHHRNFILVLDVAGRTEEARAVAPHGLSAAEVEALLERASSIRAAETPQARARVLGTIHASVAGG